MLEFDKFVGIYSFEVLLEVMLLGVVFDHALFLFAKHIGFFVR